MICKSVRRCDLDAHRVTGKRLGPERYFHSRRTPAVTRLKHPGNVMHIVDMPVKVYLRFLSCECHWR